MEEDTLLLQYLRTPCAVFHNLITELIISFHNETLIVCLINWPISGGRDGFKLSLTATIKCGFDCQ